MIPAIKHTSLIERDLNTVWHPCAQMKDYQQLPPLPIRSAKGVWIELEDGRKLIDAYSSWWCKNLGHGHPRLMNALKAQIERFEHVALPHTTHETLVEFSERITGMTQSLRKIMFASDGTCAIEMALKLSVHARKILGQTKRTEVIKLSGAYHGESLWTMAVSDLGIFRAPYDHIMPATHLITQIPYVNSTSDPVWSDAQAAWNTVQNQLEPLAHKTTAIIVEPILQAANTMRLYSADFLRCLFQFAKEHDIHIIADEVMTGLGRVGRAFAYQFTDLEPDLLCLGKGLTAGVLPLSATLLTNRIYDIFYDDYEKGKNFLHSHTHSGNALALAVANECLQVLEDEHIYDQAQQLQPLMRAHFNQISHATGMLKNIRGIGGVIAADLAVPDDQRAGFQVYQYAISQGALLRPLGNTIYWCPPLNITPAELSILADITLRSIEQFSKK